MTTPDTSQADSVILPALSAFPFPTALVVTGAPATDGGVLIEAGDVDEVFPLASVTKPILVRAGRRRPGPAEPGRPRRCPRSRRGDHRPPAVPLLGDRT